MPNIDDWQVEQENAAADYAVNAAEDAAAILGDDGSVILTQGDAKRMGHWLRGAMRRG